jgi:SAM-dependent methyltransferase
MHVAHPSRGLEMAEPPTMRAPLLGAAPPPAVVVQLLHAILRGATRRPRVAADWDAMYAMRFDHELPWQADTVDDDIAQALTRCPPPPSAVLDIGTGLGAYAIECARRGHRVVAIDLSAIALDRARALAPDAPIVWLEDDITATKLHGTFDIVLDRGCLHLLTPEQARGWAASIVRLAAPGGVLVLKTLAAGEAEPRGATPYGPRELEALLGDAFVLEHDAASTLPGPHESPAARLFLLRRR